MSTRTRTWSKAIPVDHTQIKYGPTKIRDVREDIENRVDDILAGFVDTGTTNGLLLGRLLTVGTATTTNPGTGTAAAIDIIGLTTGTMTEVVIRNSSGQSTLISYRGQLRVGQLANDEYLVGVGTTSGTVNVLKVNTAGTTQFTNPVSFDSFPSAPNTAPTTDLQLTPLGAIRNMFDTDIFTVSTAGSVTIDVKTASISSTYISGAFGAWVAGITTGVQTATTDGFAVAYLAAGYRMKAYTDGDNPPTTQVCDSNDDTANTIMFPVRKGDYWLITVTGGTPVINWLPLGI
jgi:hypothetical protein